MNLRVESRAGKRYITSCSSKGIIREAKDILDLLVCGSENETHLFLLEDGNFVAEFYDLRTGLAGEILQKCSNYRMKVAVVGPFEIVRNTSFREFMYESNKGSHVRFSTTKDEALSWLLQ